MLHIKYPNYGSMTRLQKKKICYAHYFVCSFNLLSSSKKVFSNKLSDFYFKHFFFQESKNAKIMCNMKQFCSTPVALTELMSNLFSFFIHAHFYTLLLCCRSTLGSIKLTHLGFRLLQHMHAARKDTNVTIEMLDKIKTIHWSSEEAIGYKFRYICFLYVFGFLRPHKFTVFDFFSL